MGSLHFTFHNLCVAMICGDADYTLFVKNSINHTLYALIHDPQTFHGCSEIARVPKHISICKVDDNKAVFLFLELFKKRLSNRKRTHCRSFVIRGNFWAWDNDALLAGKRDRK